MTIPRKAVVPLIISVIYVLIAVVANGSVWTTSLADEQTYLSIFDAKGYFALGQQLWGDGSIDGSRLAQRGYLFASVTGALLAIHPMALFLIQLFAVASGLFALCLVERQIAGRIRLTPLALLVPSVWLAPSHLMTESFGFALAAWGSLLMLSRASDWGAVVIWAAALVKPALLVVAVASLVLPVRRRSLVPLLVIVGLIAPQIVLTSKHSDQIALSTAGTDNFVERFHPAVMGIAENGVIVRYRDDAAQAFRVDAPKLEYKVADVLANPGAALTAWGQLLLFEHLWEPSGYLARNIEGLDPSVAAPLRRWSLWVNAALIFTLPLGVLGLLNYVRSVPYFRWPVAMVGPSIICLAPLVYWQGDRVVFIGVLLVLPFASRFLSLLARRLPI